MWSKSQKSRSNATSLLSQGSLSLFWGVCGVSYRVVGACWGTTSPGTAYICTGSFSRRHKGPKELVRVRLSSEVCNPNDMKRKQAGYNHRQTVPKGQVLNSSTTIPNRNDWMTAIVTCQGNNIIRWTRTRACRRNNIPRSHTGFTHVKVNQSITQSADENKNHGATSTEWQNPWAPRCCRPPRRGLPRLSALVGFGSLQL